MSAPSVIAGRYRLNSVIGRGGMGMVWEGFDELLRRPVAVKEVDYPLGVSEHERERLAQRTLREARAVAAVDNASAVRVFDVVEQDGKPWLVMELIRGRSLAQLLTERGPLPSHVVGRIGLAVLSALEAAHAAGVLHRDVKPGNVLVGDDGRVALTDFGIATVDKDPSETTTSVVLGSPSYIAPERAQGRPPTPAADIWALGATLWTATEGRAPYTGDNALAVLQAVAYGDPPPCTSCDPQLRDLLLDLMARDPERRPAPAAIRPRLALIAGEPQPQPPPQPQPGPATMPLPEPESAPAFAAAAATEPPPPDAHERRHPTARWLVPVLAAAAAVALIVGVVVATSGSPSRSGRTTAGHSPTSASQQSRKASRSSPPSTAAANTLPAGWTRYADPSMHWSIGVPPGWLRSQVAGGIQFTDPAGGRYFLVATRVPAGPSAVGAWQQQEVSFRSNHAGYVRLALKPVNVAGARQAADWEFDYVDGGAQLRALDRGMVFGDVGYGVFFQTHTDQWAASSELRRQVLASFRPGVTSASGASGSTAQGQAAGGVPQPPDHGHGHGPSHGQGHGQGEGDGG